MLLRRHGSFDGGIDLPDEKRETVGEPVRSGPQPERLFVPLTVTGSPPAEPIVRLGQRVQRGEQLAVGQNGGLDVFAPLGGLVAAIDATADVASYQAFRSVPAIELTDLSQPDTAPRSDEEDRGVLACSPAELRERIAAGHLTTYRRPATSLAAWVGRAHQAGCQLLVLNAMENQPYVTADHRVLVENGRDVLFGLALLARALEVGEAALAVDGRRTDDYRHLVAQADELDIQRIALPHKYPIGNDKILLKVLTGLEAPAGGSCLDVGAALVDIHACLAVTRWVRSESRTLQRVVTVSGAQIIKPANLLVPIGMRCSELTGMTPRSLTHNGPMAGLACTSNAVVTPVTDAVLAIGLSDLATPYTCIRCGWCGDHCPSRLNVAALNDAYELVDVAWARRMGATACIGCGICSYVCPSRLPLAERAKALHQAVAEDLDRRELPPGPRRRVKDRAPRQAT
jgi:electron transport complex protein RnfC